MNKEQATADATLAALGWNATKAGAATTGIGWLLSSQGAALIGICGVIIGLILQWYFGNRRDKREQAEHDLKMILRKDHLGGE
jgi:hypothetical protein